MQRKDLFGKASSMFRQHARRMTRVGVLFTLTLFATVAIAQTGGEGGIQGTVTDSTGAVVPDAVVTATAESSNVTTNRTSSSAGLFIITPLIPDSYTVTVTAKGFHVLKQQHGRHGAEPHGIQCQAGSWEYRTNSDGVGSSAGVGDYQRHPWECDRQQKLREPAADY
jgi:Carboxypeptidase regulatory-like domain